MIRGKSVSIRTMEVGDLPAVKAINDDPVVRANVVGWGWPNSEAELTRWHAASQGGNTHRWVVSSSEGDVVGVTGLWDVDLQSSHALTALKLGGKDGVRGRGLGVDAVKLVMAFAFYDLGLNRLHSSILSTNAPSQRLYLDKCGWVHEGLLRKHVWRHGQYRDVIQIGILREDFDRLPDADDYVRLATNATSPNSAYRLAPDRCLK